MNATATTPTAQAQIRVGTSWTNASGKTWTVFEVLPFGRVGIRSGYLFAEMKTSDVRRAIAKAA